MPSLRDPKLTLRWAKEHLDILDKRISQFEKTYKLKVSAEEDTQEQFYVVRAQLAFPEQESFDIACTCGDFIFRLRASLDHLAWQLALFSGSMPGRDICFPICEKNSIDTQIKIAKTTFGIPDEAIAVMKSFQPYHAGDLYKTHSLWRLNKLWNIDKHRHLPGHGGASEPFLHVAAPDFQIKEEWFDGEDIVRIPLALKDKVTFKPDTPIRFLFMDAAEGWELSIDDMSAMYQFVADTVFPAFARFFK